MVCCGRRHDGRSGLHFDLGDGSDDLDRAIDHLNRSEAGVGCSALFPCSVPTRRGTPFRDASSGGYWGSAPAPAARDHLARRAGNAMPRGRLDVTRDWASRKGLGWIHIHERQLVEVGNGLSLSRSVSRCHNYLGHHRGPRGHGCAWLSRANELEGPGVHEVCVSFVVGLAGRSARADEEGAIGVGMSVRCGQGEGPLAVRASDVDEIRPLGRRQCLRARRPATPARARRRRRGVRRGGRAGRRSPGDRRVRRR